MKKREIPLRCLVNQHVHNFFPKTWRGNIEVDVNTGARAITRQSIEVNFCVGTGWCLSQHEASSGVAGSSSAGLWMLHSEAHTHTHTRARAPLR